MWKVPDIMPDDKKPNRLINEKSPYLLQHAYNPVDWYPWGDEAFEKAKEEDKPIFLSIGYSTCHWCHVMERESFEDLEVAKVLNKHFISIKVDREERPDIDNIYMNICQVLTGSGGWPLTIFMTPDKKPFFAGTYFPKQDRMGMNGLISLLEIISKEWSGNRNKILHSSNEILDAIKQPEYMKSGELDENSIEEAFLHFKSAFDDEHGGFGSAPKFPSPQNLFFLLRYWYKTKNENALYMVEKTLDSMYKGGIFDHIGFGFSRYSTDRYWLVPHFEKMLYDNALLAIAYIETYQITRNEKYSKAAVQIFTYILRDMTSPEGGFYSAEDADSEGEEGRFYTFAFDEIKALLGDDDGSKFCEYYNITAKGNFDGRNILNLIKSNKEIDTEFISKSREKVFNYRNKRVHPYKDDKILTSWNGLMIASLAIGGRVLGKSEYVRASVLAASFIIKNLIRKDGRLLARYREGDAAIPAFVDDYAFLVWGLIELYETTYNPEYLKIAVDLNNDLIKYFWDDKNGGLFVYGNDSEQLITRSKEIYDGAAPSGNSVSALNFLRLARLTGNSELEDKSRLILNAFSNSIESYPAGYSFSLMVLLYFKSKSKEIVIAADDMNETLNDIVDIINNKFRPFTISLLYSNENKEIVNTVPGISDYKTIDGKPTVYICENFSCMAPVTDLVLFKQILQE